MQEMHALEFLDAPLRTSALLVRNKDVEQPFRQVTDCTQGLHVGGAEIRGIDEFPEQRKQPFIVGEEDSLTHDEHVAESRFTPVEHGVGILPVIRVPGTQDVIHVTQIAEPQVGIRRPVLLQAAESANAAHIVAWRGDDVPAVHSAGDGLIVQTVFGNRPLVDIGIDDLAVVVLPVLDVSEVEIAAVVTEAVIVGIRILPCPVLGGQFAVHGVERGDVLPFVVVQRVLEQFGRVLRPHLDGQNRPAGGESRRPMRRDEQFDHGRLPHGNDSFALPAAWNLTIILDYCTSCNPRTAVLRIPRIQRIATVHRPSAALPASTTASVHR